MHTGLILSYRQKYAKNLDFGRISGFHEKFDYKPSSSDPNKYTHTVYTELQ